MAPVLLLLFAVSGAISPAQGERSDLPKAGDRVRVESPALGPGRVVGVLLDGTEEKLTLRLDGTRVVDVARADLRQFEVSRGDRDNAGRGAGTGAFVGLGLTLAKIAIDGGCYEDVGGCGVYFVAGGLATAATTLVGMMIGATISSERWEKVQPSVSLGLGPARGKGVAVALSVRF